MTMKHELRLFSSMILLSCVAACAEGSGTVQIFVVPEGSISEGIASGADPENIQDGFSVAYERFLVSVGGFRAKRSDDGSSVEDDGRYVLDLVNAPTNGYVVHEFRGVASARWDKFGYDLPNARAGAQPLPPTLPADADFMIENGYSIYFEGAATKDAVTTTFRWGFAAGTAFDDCSSVEGIPGFAVPEGGTVSVKPTIHGDHQFFDNVTQGVEKTQRLARWVETCDADGDRDLTILEIQACDVVLVLPQPPYDLTGVVDHDGNGRLSVYDFVASQMRTVGDYQGDGECPTRVPIP